MPDLKQKFLGVQNIYCLYCFITCLLDSKFCLFECRLLEIKLFSGCQDILVISFMTRTNILNDNQKICSFCF